MEAILTGIVATVVGSVIVGAITWIVESQRQRRRDTTTSAEAASKADRSWKNISLW